MSDPPAWNRLREDLRRDRYGSGVPLPERISKYRIEAEIGHTGSSTVYLGYDAELARRVAIKILRPDRSLPDFITRFQREGRMAASVRHPNVIVIHEVGTWESPGGGPVPYIVMDYVEGGTLSGKRLTFRQVAEIGAAIADAIDHSHKSGIIHRDLKPANVLLDATGRPIVTDFGLAKSVDLRDAASHEGMLMGTPQYMAPEQVLADGTPVDGRTDVYAIGAVLYELLARIPPHSAKSPAILFQRILQENPKPLSSIDPEIPPDLETVVFRALEKKPERRYPSAGELALDLRQWLAGAPIHARRPWAATGRRLIARVYSELRRRTLWVAAALALAAGVTALGVWSGKAKPGTPSRAPSSSSSWEDLGGSAAGAGLNRTPGPTERASLCLDRLGRPVVAWRDASTGNGEIYLRRWDGTAWIEVGGSASGGGISRTPGDSKAPSVAIDEEDHPVVTWFEEVGGDYAIYLRKWDGRAWTELDHSGTLGGISRGASRSVHPVLALDPRGFPVVCWYCLPKGGPGGRKIYLKRWDGKQWVELGGSATGGGVTSTAGEAYMPCLALDPSGNPTVVWHDNASGNAEVYLRQWNGTAWIELGGSATGGGISKNSGHSVTFSPSSVRLDSRGYPTVVWHDDSSGNYEIYLRRWNGQAWVELGGSASGGGISRTPGLSVLASLVLSPSGQPVVVWREEVSAGVQKTFLRYWDGGAWLSLGGSTSVAGLNSTPGSALDPVVAIDPGGRPTVAWNDVEPSRASRIYLRRWAGAPIQ